MKKRLSKIAMYIPTITIMLFTIITLCGGPGNVSI